VIIIAVKKASGRMVFNPGPDYFLENSDVLITLGNRDQLRALERALK
jgi:voltage-gated potassium channel